MLQLAPNWLTFGPAKSHSLTCVVQRGTDAEWPDDHSPVAQDPTGKKGKHGVFFLFFFFSLLSFLHFSPAGGEVRVHKKRSVTRCLLMSPTAQLNSINKIK